MSQCSLKENWKNVRWHPYPVYKFTNRMRSTHHPSGLQLFYLMTTGQSGVRFTTYKLDDTPHPVHPVNNLWTGGQAVRFLNFKKWEPDGLIRVPYQKLQSCLIKKGYLGNFNKDSFEIKILYRGAGRGYGWRKNLSSYWHGCWWAWWH